VPLLLVRHGESEGNVEGYVQGQIDHPLTDLGRVQAEAVAERLKDEGGVDRLVASPLSRALTTAEAIGGALDLPVVTDPRLMEYDFGEISGLTVMEVLERYPGWRFWNDSESAELHPGEEGMPAFDGRVAEVLTELMEAGGRTVAVTHGGVVMSALNAALRMHGVVEPGHRRARFPMKNCAITELDRDGEGRLMLRRHNDACHLPAGTAPHRSV
jgi:broad specificity phosphatase PhoE